MPTETIADNRIQVTKDDALRALGAVGLDHPGLVFPLDFLIRRIDDLAERVAPLAEIDRKFHELAIKERDFERMVTARLQEELQAANEHAIQLLNAIRWALGELGDFTIPPAAQRGAFWWRTELRRRAGLTE